MLMRKIGINYAKRYKDYWRQAEANQLGSCLPSQEETGMGCCGCTMQGDAMYKADKLKSEIAVDVAMEMGWNTPSLTPAQMTVDDMTGIPYTAMQAEFLKLIRSRRDE